VDQHNAIDATKAWLRQAQNSKLKGVKIPCSTQNFPSSATPSVTPITSVAGTRLLTLGSYGVAAAGDAARCGVACSVRYVAAGGRRAKREGNRSRPALGFSAVKRERHCSQYCCRTDNPKHTELFHDRSSIFIIAFNATCG